MIDVFRKSGRSGFSVEKSRTAKLFVAFIGAIAARYPYWVFQFDAGNLKEVKPWSNGFQLMCKWDCVLYAGLSQHYTSANSAFFPGFPVLIRLTSSLLPSLGSVAATLLVSNIFAVIGTILALFFADQLWDDPAESRFLGFRNRSWFLLIALSLFPSSQFWTRGFSEPVFFVGLVALIWFAKLGHWRAGSVAAGLLAVLRPQGVWVCGLYVMYYFARRYVAWRSGKKRLDLLEAAAVLIFAVTPFGLFTGWLWRETGHPFYFYGLQAGWGRHFSLLTGLLEHRPRFDAAVGFLYLSLYATYRFAKRSGDHWKLLGILTFALADLPMYFGGYLSYMRFMSVNVGLLVILAEIAAEQPYLGIIMLGWSLAQLAVQTYHASFGMWTG